MIKNYLFRRLPTLNEYFDSEIRLVEKTLGKNLRPGSLKTLVDSIIYDITLKVVWRYEHLNGKGKNSIEDALPIIEDYASREGYITKLKELYHDWKNKFKTTIFTEENSKNKTNMKYIITEDRARELVAKIMDRHFPNFKKGKVEIDVDNKGDKRVKKYTYKSSTYAKYYPDDDRLRLRRDVYDVVSDNFKNDQMELVVSWFNKEFGEKAKSLIH